LSLPIFVLYLELVKSVWRHVHAAKVLVMHNILEGASDNARHHGATIDLEFAAGLGRMDLMPTFGFRLGGPAGPGRQQAQRTASHPVTIHAEFSHNHQMISTKFTLTWNSTAWTRPGMTSPRPMPDTIDEQGEKKLRSSTRAASGAASNERQITLCNAFPSCCSCL
jgi:hypothetical protein